MPPLSLAAHMQAGTESPTCPKNANKVVLIPTVEDPLSGAISVSAETTGLPVTELRECGFLIFHTRERRGSTSRMASCSVLNSVSVAQKPTPAAMYTA